MSAPLEIVEILRKTILMVSPVVDAIHYWPNAPRPSTNYAAVGINAMEQVYYGEFKDADNITDGDLDRSQAQLFNLTIGVNFYRVDAMLNASLFSGGLINNEVVEYWNSEKIALVSRSNIRDITQVINASFEDRAQMDITIQSLITMPQEKILSVNSIRIAGDVHNAGGEIANVDIEFDVPN